MTYPRNMPRPHFYRDQYGRLYIDGLLFMGKHRIPPMPNHIIMRDRFDDESLSLSHTGSPGTLTLDLITPNDRWTDISVFGPYDGPYVGNFRLYIENNVLLAEAVNPDTKHGNLRVLTRKNFERTMLEIGVDANGAITTTELTV